MSSQLFKVTEHIVPGQHIREHADFLRHDQEDVLKLHVKQYTPTSAPDPSLPSVTLVAAHGNGFAKELSEPLWEEIVSRAKASRFNIRGIWMADAASQGQSYVLNEDRLSDDVGWLDHSRDLLHLINHFRADMRRPIVGIGHSMGGTQLVELSLMHPRLLSGLILLDPVLQPATPAQAERGLPHTGLANLSTYRRDLWPSRTEAARAMRTSSMFASWDAKVWERFVKYSLRDLPTQVYPDLPEGASSVDPPVTLTTPRNIEIHTFVRANFEVRGKKGDRVDNNEARVGAALDERGPTMRVFSRPEPEYVLSRLPQLQVPTLFVLGGKSFSVEGSADKIYEVVGTGIVGYDGDGERGRRVKQVVLEGVSHAVPMEAPTMTAEVAVEWIGEIANEWQKDEIIWKQRQTSKTIRDHVEPSDEWKRHIGPRVTKSKKTDSKM